jgi:hypothetical protein
VVGREAVSLEDHLVVGHRRVDPPGNEVIERGLDIVRDAHPHDGRLGEAGQRRALVSGLAQAQAVIAGRHLAPLLVLTHRREPLRGAPAVVGMAGFEQPLDKRPVGLQPFGLSIGRAGTADIGPLVPGQAQPVQGVEDLPLAVLLQPRAVGVLDPQQEPATLLAGEGQVEHGHIGGADVRVTRG